MWRVAWQGATGGKRVGLEAIPALGMGGWAVEWLSKCNRALGAWPLLRPRAVFPMLCPGISGSVKIPEGTERGCTGQHLSSQGLQSSWEDKIIPSEAFLKHFGADGNWLRSWLLEIPVETGVTLCSETSKLDFWGPYTWNEQTSRNVSLDSRTCCPWWQALKPPAGMFW